MKQKNHCCKALHAGISFLGIGSYLMLIGISLITASLAYDSAIHGKTAEVLRLLWVITMSGTLSLRIMSVQRHMMLSSRFRQMSVGGRFACLVLIFLPPVPEVMGIVKLGFKKSIVVPNFWCEHQETASINATKLVESIREKYFATAECDDSPDIIISTNTGTLITLLIRDSSLYLFVPLGEAADLPLDLQLPSDSHWSIEKSLDGNAGALVCEVLFTPRSISGNTEVELSEIILDLVNELSLIEKGNDC